MRWEGVMEFLILPVGLVVGFVAFFLPTFVSMRRNHRNHLAIVTLNFVLIAVWLWLGSFFFFLGWVIALIWACLAQRRDAVKA
jgi:predicted branched-subunit amino acid permease